MSRFFEFSLSSGLEGLEQRLSLSGLVGAMKAGAVLRPVVVIEDDDEPPFVPDPEPVIPVYPTPDVEPDPGDFPGFPPPPVFPTPPLGGPIGPA